MMNRCDLDIFLLFYLLVHSISMEFITQDTQHTHDLFAHNFSVNIRR